MPPLGADRSSRNAEHNKIRSSSSPGDWARVELAFMPDGNMLVRTERAGKLASFETACRSKPIEGRAVSKELGGGAA